MALVNYNVWQRIAVAVLDALTDGDRFQRRDDLIVRVWGDTLGEFDKARIAAMIDRLTGQGSVRKISDSTGTYYTLNDAGIGGIAAMRDVWKGKFDGK